jgi:hypothetical protein
MSSHSTPRNAKSLTKSTGTSTKAGHVKVSSQQKGALKSRGSISGGKSGPARSAGSTESVESGASIDSGVGGTTKGVTQRELIQV